MREDDHLTIKFLGVEASATGRFAIIAVVAIFMLYGLGRWFSIW
ncbi:hypothetical protein [Rhizobium sp. NPDC090279]